MKLTILAILLVASAAAQINPSTRGPRGATGAAGPTGPTGPAATQAFAPVSNAGTDVVCALHADSITGLTCNNQVTDGTTITAFATTTTIPAGTLTTGVTVPVNLVFGNFGTATLPTVQISIKLGSTVIYTSTAAAQIAGSAAPAWNCEISALAAASATTPLATSCAADSLSRTNRNSLLTNTNKSIAVNTTASQVLSVTVVYGAATVGNAIWLYSISPGSGGAVGPTGPAGVFPNHLTAGGTSPTIASGFGTGNSIAGKDSAFIVTIGTTASAATGVVTFGAAWTTAPVCLAGSDEAQADNGPTLSAAATTTNVTITLTNASSYGTAAHISVHCIGY